MWKRPLARVQFSRSHRFDTRPDVCICNVRTINMAGLHKIKLLTTKLLLLKYNRIFFAGKTTLILTLTSGIYLHFSHINDKQWIMKCFPRTKFQRSKNRWEYLILCYLYFSFQNQHSHVDNQYDPDTSR
jgi:hypothetical protein